MFTWTNPLSSLSTFGSLLAWAAILAVPPLIVLLYFLKLKRMPLEVPSTYLWHKSIEDLHVNSIWQKLRQSLLLFLQLLLLMLLILALAGPAWRGDALVGGRYIFVVDNSASMSATDIAPTRLDEAKLQVGTLIDQMKSGDSAMLVSFSDTAKVEQNFTDNRKLLRQRLADIQPTQRTTALDEALKIASGLANPGKSAFKTDDAPVAEALKAELFVFSDGRFADVKDFFWGNLTPTYVAIGDPAPANVGIAAFSTRRHEDDPSKLQAFARIENFGSTEATVQAELYVNDVLRDASQLAIPEGDAKGVSFELDEIESGVLTLKLAPPADAPGVSNDALAADNTAWATVNKPQRAKVLCVTPGNLPLEYALLTGRAAELADVALQPPSFLETPEYQQQASTGTYDLVIFDRCQPAGQPVPKMPRSNTFFIGVPPPVEGWQADPKIAVPQIIDTDRSHPLLQLVELGDVLIADATPFKPPAAGRTLIFSNQGSLLCIAPRDGFEDLALAFELVGADDTVGSNWHVRLSFPLFILNVLQYLGQGQDALATGSVQPGRAVMLRSETPAERVTVVSPGKKTTELARGKGDAFHFAGTDELGIYELQADGKTINRFAVNLFDPGESQIKPRPRLPVGGSDVQASAGYEPARREVWKALVLAGLAVLLLEWYIYNRRIYL
ncbi:MAG: VWA domain-containing protein [Pirellulales bacterium]